MENWGAPSAPGRKTVRWGEVVAWVGGREWGVSQQPLNGSSSRLASSGSSSSSRQAKGSCATKAPGTWWVGLGGGAAAAEGGAPRGRRGGRHLGAHFAAEHHAAQHGQRVEQAHAVRRSPAVGQLPGWRSEHARGGGGGKRVIGAARGEDLLLLPPGRQAGARGRLFPPARPPPPIRPPALRLPCLSPMHSPAGNTPTLSPCRWARGCWRHAAARAWGSVGTGQGGGC